MSATPPLHYMEVVEVVQWLKTGRISATELMRHTLERIGRLDPGLHSFAFLDEGLALEEAAKADRALAANRADPLSGVPIAVKDIFWTSDMPTAGGMAIHKGFRPASDATVVRRLREAGAVVFGKLQMTEGAFAVHHPSIEPPQNPWDNTLWVGASSSGSGAAVAAGLSHASLGTDTGGSIRFPCNVGNLTGLKPSWGRVSRYGAFAFAPSLDHVGPIARSARDAALLYRVIAGHDTNDPTSWPDAPEPDTPLALSALRIGYAPRLAAQLCDETLLTSLAGVHEVLRNMGAEPREVELPDLAVAASHWEMLAGVEAAVVHADTYPSRKAEYGEALSRLIDLGRATSATDYWRACAVRMELRGALDTLFAGIDILVLPVLPYAAPTLDRLGALAQDPEANTRLITFTAPFDMSGHPAISLPSGPDPSGAPLGFQMVAGRGRERLLLRVATALQQETSWHKRHPATEGER